MTDQPPRLLRVFKVEGEATRFHVESGTLGCDNPQCGATYNRRTRHRLNPPERQPTDYLRVEGACPKCGAGRLQLRWHLVDIAARGGLGECSCEYWQFGLAREVERMLPSEVALALAAGRKRCSHIEAARQFALDLSIKLHEAERHRLAGRQREEAQP